ncbi:uncharacterized protein LOC110534479 isoform X2 [Oncorhynchus mykiss]|uniref:uncharacterized protein LOC110534479 isoform X2 n=1 Tax=Oncorhynchus mykiss TaxID=8022 RepID=UPI0018778AFE|nr:uncharacterized protein LOC110534479 isoform X2 [Oncorhynchus mykiss]
MRGFILFAILVIAHAHSSIAALVIKGPDKPVLENDEVTLECLLSDSELNTSQVHFEKFSKYMNKWYRLEEEPMYRRCIPDVILRREASQLLLSIRSIHSYFHQGLYRCVADNATATDNSSQPLAITINYMRELSVYDVSSSSRKFIKENLLVTLGEDVEVECSTTASEAPQYFWQKYGEDWIVPSSKLRLKNVRMEDGGDYTCMAEHPTLSSLKKSSTISITVLTVMTTLRRSPSTQPVWSLWPLPVETNNHWCDRAKRWRREVGEQMEKDGKGGKGVRNRKEGRC